MKLTPILIALCALLSSSCSAGGFSTKHITASGSDITGTVPANDIYEISSSQAIVVNYTVGSPVSVSYSVPEFLAEYFIVECKNGKLICRFKDGTSINFNNRKAVVNVTAPAVSDFSASSASSINVKGQLKVEELDVDVSSAATIQIASVTANSVDIDSSSAGSVSITAVETESLEMDASSSGSVNVKGNLGNVEVDASSNGSVTVKGNLGNVDIEASSAASVLLGGTCKILNASLSSGASLEAPGTSISTGNLHVSSGASITVPQATETPYKTSKSSGGKIHVK